MIQNMDWDIVEIKYNEWYWIGLFNNKICLTASTNGVEAHNRRQINRDEYSTISSKLLAAEQVDTTSMVFVFHNWMIDGLVFIAMLQASVILKGTAILLVRFWLGGCKIALPKYCGVIR
jgi:hypothetical protein